MCTQNNFIKILTFLSSRTVDEFVTSVNVAALLKTDTSHCRGRFSGIIIISGGYLKQGVVSRDHEQHAILRPTFDRQRHVNRLSRSDPKVNATWHIRPDKTVIVFGASLCSIVSGTEVTWHKQRRGLNCTSGPGKIIRLCRSVSRVCAVKKGRGTAERVGLY